MEIIFTKLPKYLDHLCIILAKAGNRIYYLELPQGAGDDKESVDRRVKSLRNHNIVPLPIEDLPKITWVSELISDPDNKVLEKTRRIAPGPLLDALGKLYPNITGVPQKLEIAIHAAIAPQMLYKAGKVNVWARENPGTRHLLIDITPDGYYIPGLEQNVRLLVIPVDIVAQGFGKIIHLLRRMLPKRRSPGGVPVCPPVISRRQPPRSSRVALVTHHGLSYGNLFPKYIFYSPRADSDLHEERLLHIDYCGWNSPSEKLNWVCMGNHQHSWISNACSAVAALGRGILHIRRFRHILGLIVLVRSYVIFRSFAEKLDAYPDLKLALIDYEILCPNELLLALESKGVQTVAVQERFFTTFSNLLGSTILSDYLCHSPFTADVMKRSPLYSVSRFVPVGQYRSDKLLEAKRSVPPEILKGPLAQGKKIITALGFHAVKEWQNARSELYTNWKAHKQFLNDMIRLSEEIPGVFIILRYKFTDWITMPVFAEEIEKIQTSENIAISMDYDRYFISYELCAHSDLVIAKPTSIADECLSVGIPVLFHDYTHNADRLISVAFDYAPARIMCHRYDEIRNKARIILGSTPHEMTGDYEYLMQEVFGGLGDGRVTERIRHYLEKRIQDS